MTTMLEARSGPLLQRLEDWFDLPEVWRGFTRMPAMIRVEESTKDGMLTIRAEIPGIDPEKDVEITLEDGMLTIAAERREQKREGNGAMFSEFRYGSFRRSLRVPREVKPDDVAAMYQDGILSITVPVPAPAAAGPTKVAVARS